MWDANNPFIIFLTKTVIANKSLFHTFRKENPPKNFFNTGFSLCFFMRLNIATTSLYGTTHLNFPLHNLWHKGNSWRVINNFGIKIPQMFPFSAFCSFYRLLRFIPYHSIRSITTYQIVFVKYICCDWRF